MRARRSSSPLARQSIAITSDAAVMSKPVSRGTPCSTPPSPMIDLAQRAVVHVDHPAPEHAARIDPQAVVVVDVVVEQRGEQVVRGR